MHKVLFHAMGCDVELAVVDDTATMAEIQRDLEDARSEIERLASLLSRFVPGSDVCQLNDHPGQWIPVHNETAQVLLLAEQAHRDTGGLFSPCLGTWMERYGYDRSFEQVPRLDLDGPRLRPPHRPPSEALPLHATPGMDRKPQRVPYEIGSGGRFRLDPGYKIDLGGIAKGWIVEQAAELLQTRGYRNFVCSAGGDMVCAGTAGEMPWSVGIANPDNLSESVLTLAVDASCVATSGTYRRRWQSDGIPRHHILDPRTGQPSASDLVSCTVVHERLVVAEVMAKVFLLLGRDDGLNWVRSMPHRGWVAVTTTGEVLHAWKS